MCRRCSPPTRPTPPTKPTRPTKPALHLTLSVLSSPNDLRVRLLNPEADAGAVRYGRYGSYRGCSCGGGKPRVLTLLSLLPRAGGCIAAVCGVGLLAATAWHIVHKGGGLPDSRMGAAGPTTASTASRGCARQIWVIRHGEKPKSGLDLSDDGDARAEFLGKLVKSGTWPSFSLVFASDPTPPQVKREFETVHPLAKVLGVGVNTTFTKDEGDALAAAALEAARTWVPCGGAVLISWEHCRMPQLLQALGCVVAQCEQCWPDGRYDRVERLGVGDTISEYLGHAAEGYAEDDESFGADYECLDSVHKQDTDCWLPDGRHVGDGISEPRYRGMVHSG